MLRRRPEVVLLATAPEFRLLLLARLFSGVGTWLAFFALVVTVFDRTGSAHWVSALVVADLLPAAIVGLALGYLVDRLSRRGVMIVSDLIGFEIFALLPLVASTAGLIALTAVAAAAAAFFRPAAYAAVPNLVPEKDLVHANALMQSAENVTTVAAPLVGGIIVASAGTEIAFWVNAGSFLVSALLVWLIPGEKLHGAAEDGAGQGRALTEIREGLRLVRRTPVLRTIFFSWAVVTVVFGVATVTEVVLAKEAYGAGDFGFGVFVAAAATGLVLGNVAAPALIGRMGTRRAYAIGFGFMAIGAIGAAAAPSVAGGSISACALGVGNGLGLVVNVTLLQRALSDDVRGRAFAFMGGVVSIAMLAGMIVAGPLAETVGVRAVWNGVGVVLAAAGILVLAVRSLQHAEPRLVSPTRPVPARKVPPPIEAERLDAPPAASDQEQAQPRVDPEEAPVPARETNGAAVDPARERVEAHSAGVHSIERSRLDG